MIKGNQCVNIIAMSKHYSPVRYKCLLSALIWLAGAKTVLLSRLIDYIRARDQLIVSNATYSRFQLIVAL